MAYCTITEVRGLNPKATYNTGTNPTTTEVEEFIDRISDQIDVVLQGRGFTTPITAPTELANFLIQVNAYGAAALAEQAMYPEASGIGMTSHHSVLWRQYQEALKYLREGRLPTTVDGSGVPFSFAEQHQATETEPSEEYPWQKPKFGINKEF